MAFQMSNSPFLCYPSESPHLSSVLSLSLHLPAPNHPSSTSNLRINPKILNSNCRRRRAMSVNCQTTEERLPTSENRILVFVPPHPSIKHWVSVLRNEQTPCAVFKNAMAELGRLLIYEASRDWLPTISGEIQSPLGPAAVEFIDPQEPIVIVPILRASLALAEYASSILPATKIYHLGISRDEETLQPTVYLNKFPEKLPEGSRVFVLDPALATGTYVVQIIAALELIKRCGADNNQIKVISALAAPPALQKLGQKFPGLHVYSGILDPTVNDKGYIIPGLEMLETVALAHKYQILRLYHHCNFDIPSARERNPKDYLLNEELHCILVSTISYITYR